MTGTLKVTPEELKTTAGKFQNEGEQIKTQCSTMVTTVQNLCSSAWQGDAAKAYLDKFEALQGDINSMVSMITEHVTDLNTMASEYENTEAENASAAQALETDVIH